MLPMKALVLSDYTTPDKVLIKEVNTPVPKENEVLVKVRAASINFNNLIFIKGTPLVARPFTGFFKPNIPTPGNDMAGIVEAVGSDVSAFKIGDQVFSDTIEHGSGAFAEYVCVPEETLTPMPENLDFEQAAAVPEACLAAYQALMDCAGIKPGQNILICGASGGIGTLRSRWQNIARQK
jgi:NADPH:quinone reductase-like Zn-dependent oxidoreductase